MLSVVRCLLYVVYYVAYVVCCASRVPYSVWGIDCKLFCVMLCVLYDAFHMFGASCIVNHVWCWLYILCVVMCVVQYVLCVVFCF